MNFPPLYLYRWQNRFDDIAQRYRTIYAAAERSTAIREVIQDFRPNTKAIADYSALFGTSGLTPVGRVTRAWRQSRALAPARVRANGPLANLDDVALLQRLEVGLAALLSGKNIPHLDISAIRSRDRELTQHVSRTLYDDNFAGLIFRSDCDDQPCYVLFEHEGRLLPDGAPEPCTAPIPELIQVCAEYGLVLEDEPLSMGVVRGDGLLRRLLAWFQRSP